MVRYGSSDGKEKIAVRWSIKYTGSMKINMCYNFIVDILQNELKIR